jgi:hypothetical protein
VVTAVAFAGTFIAWFFPIPGKQFSPLQPVLRDNFWLTIHVLTIVSSYAAGALAWGLGCLSLGYYLLGRYGAGAMGKRKPPEACTALAGFIYNAMQVAVLLLAAGTILGGLWADVSWGRFWGWDPKEVWALVSLLAYIAILHGRYAGWIGTFGLAAGSVIGAAVIGMSWYGVNFLLGAGLHSYGFGQGGRRSSSRSCSSTSRSWRPPPGAGSGRPAAPPDARGAGGRRSPPARGTGGDREMVVRGGGACRGFDGRRPPLQTSGHRSRHGSLFCSFSLVLRQRQRTNPLGAHRQFVDPQLLGMREEPGPEIGRHQELVELHGGEIGGPQHHVGVLDNEFSVAPPTHDAVSVGPVIPQVQRIEPEVEQMADGRRTLDVRLAVGPLVLDAALAGHGLADDSERGAVVPAPAGEIGVLEAFAEQDALRTGPGLRMRLCRPARGKQNKPQPDHLHENHEFTHDTLPQQGRKRPREQPCRPG